jgi:hypothetical protein
MKDKLIEVRNCRQIRGEPQRRWFANRDLDLIVWFGEKNDICGFQFCYRETNAEYAVTWEEKQGFRRQFVDSGDGYPRRRAMTPILVGNFAKPTRYLADVFRDHQDDIDPRLAGFVEAILQTYQV